MSLITLAATVLSVLLALILLGGLYMLRSMFLPTRGKKIGPYTHPTSALLVLDIQESSSTSKTPLAPLPTATPLGQMIESVNRLIECFAGTGREVAYVRQVFTCNLVTRIHGGRILTGRLEPRICRWIKVVNSNDFIKNRTDAFSNRQLEQFLIERQVAELYLVGLDAAFCVYYTALGALQRGYRVTVVTDAVMTGRNWQRVLERYQRKGINVMATSEILQEITRMNQRPN